MSNGLVDTIPIMEHRNELTYDAKPSFQQPYRGGSMQGKLDEEEIEKMLKLYVIDPAILEWDAQMLFATKKCGELRFCVDYYRLNYVFVRDS